MNAYNLQLIGTLNVLHIVHKNIIEYIQYITKNALGSITSI